MNYLRIRLTFC